MKFEVRNRYRGEIQFTAEIDCSEDAAQSVKLGLAVTWAVRNGANLRMADLTEAYLYGAKGQRGELLVGSNPIITIGPMGSRRDSLIIQNYADDVWVKAGCFFGSIADFKEKVIATHGNNNHAKNYLAACDFIQAWRLTQIG